MGYFFYNSCELLIALAAVLAPLELPYPCCNPPFRCVLACTLHARRPAPASPTRLATPHRHAPRPTGSPQRRRAPSMTHADSADIELLKDIFDEIFDEPEEP